MIATLEDLKLELFLRQRESGDLVWKTKNNEVIPIKNLELNHLQNIINSFNKHIEQSVNIQHSSLNFY